MLIIEQMVLMHIQALKATMQMHVDVNIVDGVELDT